MTAIALREKRGRPQVAKKEDNPFIPEEATIDAIENDALIALIAEAEGEGFLERFLHYRNLEAKLFAKPFFTINEIEEVAAKVCGTTNHLKRVKAGEERIDIEFRDVLTYLFINKGGVSIKEIKDRFRAKHGFGLNNHGFNEAMRHQAWRDRLKAICKRLVELGVEKLKKEC